MNPVLPLQFRRVTRGALIAASSSSVICILGAINNRLQFCQSWLVAWIFFAGLSFGALVILMMQSLTGGAWGFVIRRFCEAAMMTLPLIALLFVPVIFGAHQLFPWLRDDELATHSTWQHKQAYLNFPFFVMRSAFYFVATAALAFLLRQFSVRCDGSGKIESADKWIPRVSGGGLVLYVLCMNFASTDWVMSLEPDWYSTMFVVIFMAGQFLSTLALMIVLLAVFAGMEPFVTIVTTKHFHDLGNLLLAFIVFWTYVSFSQFLIIWSGNLPKEISWYLHRAAGGWKGVVLFLMTFQFLAPFALLLLRTTKQKRKRLGVIAGTVLVASFINVYWIIVPSFHPEGVHVHWLDFAALLAVGGFWTAMFLTLLARQPLLPLLAGKEVRDA